MNGDKRGFIFLSFFPLFACLPVSRKFRRGRKKILFTLFLCCFPRFLKFKAGKRQQGYGALLSGAAARTITCGLLK
jgi:hypothetical protein